MVKMVILELSLKCITIVKSIKTINPVLFQILHLSSEIGTIRIVYLSLDKISVLELSLKYTLLLFPSSFAVWLVIPQLSLINIPVRILKGTLLWHSVLKSSLKHTSIWIFHNSFAMVPPLIITFTLIKRFILIISIRNCLLFLSRIRIPHFKSIFQFTGFFLVFKFLFI